MMLKSEIKKLVSVLKNLDRQTFIVFVSVAILQTVSWYFTSRRFFRDDIATYFSGDVYLPLYEFYYWFTGDFIVYFVIPLLIVIFVFKKKPADFGLQMGDYKIGLKFTLLFLSVMIPFIWFISSSSNFIIQYPLLAQARSDWSVFLIYQIGIIIYLIAWEFIWRGYMLFGLFDKFGYNAILFQMLPFVVLHNGKPFMETLAAIAGGIILGYFAIRTKSILYCIITHAGIMFTIDLIASLRYRSSDYGIGVSSILNVLKELF